MSAAPDKSLSFIAWAVSQFLRLSPGPNPVAPFLASNPVLEIIKVADTPNMRQLQGGSLQAPEWRLHPSTDPKPFSLANKMGEIGASITASIKTAAVEIL